ncbi:MAG: Gp49 family protein [Fluviibacter sp.]
MADKIQKEIRRKKLKAPRVKPDQIKKVVLMKFYFTAWEALFKDKPDDWNPPLKALLDTHIFCVLAMKNGFIVTGESACVSPENFDRELGEKIALRHAEAKIWPLLGYEMKSKLAGK